MLDAFRITARTAASGSDGNYGTKLCRVRTSIILVLIPVSCIILYCTNGLPLSNSDNPLLLLYLALFPTVGLQLVRALRYSYYTFTVTVPKRYCTGTYTARSTCTRTAQAIADSSRPYYTVGSLL
jgi:hypothetical protein